MQCVPYKESEIDGLSLDRVRHIMNKLKID